MAPTLYQLIPVNRKGFVLSGKQKLKDSLTAMVFDTNGADVVNYEAVINITLVKDYRVLYLLH